MNGVNNITKIMFNAVDRRAFFSLLGGGRGGGGGWGRLAGPLLYFVGETGRLAGPLLYLAGEVLSKCIRPFSPFHFSLSYSFSVLQFRCQFTQTYLVSLCSFLSAIPC